MEQFEFYNPVRVVFGKDAIDRLGEAISDMGRKVFLVYGMGSIKKIGVYDKVIKILEDESKKVSEHGGVKANPVLSHAREGIEKVRKDRADFILAVGGGSVIDEAKAIAAGALYKGDVWDFYAGKAEIEEAMPIVVVSTLPATGSEMNGGTVLTNDETDDKFGLISEPLHPVCTFMDPQVTYSIPKDYTAYAGVDAISHCIEGYFTHTTPWAPVQERYIEGLVKAIMESIEAILEKPDDYYARAAFMWAASLAWNGLTAAGLEGAGVPSHMLAHPLSGLYNLAHGATLAITIPAWMRWSLGEGNSRLEGFARNVMGVTKRNPQKAAEDGIEAVKEWFTKIGCPVTLKDADIPEGDIDRIAEKAYDLAVVWQLDKAYPKELIKQIFSYAL